ncbi:MAG TPA: hypothetical protein VNI60_06005, partial [Pyrinomonadaceae bacterium]|nr:hypothetical protein [Pyrinomonadaceae bacterium]
VDYLKANVPAMEKFIATSEATKVKGDRYTNFDKAIDASNTAGIFTSGKEILAQEPDFVDVTIALASAGFDQSIANPPVDTFSNDTITYSKMAIQQIEANKSSKTGNYGVKKYSYKTDQFGGKENALGLMNYNIGYILYYRQGKNDPAKKKEALPYFFKSTQYNAFSKTDPFVYQTIGAWYLDEAIRMNADRDAKLKEAGNKDTDETLAVLGMQKGYVDRSIDAYARAYKLASAAADTKRKDALYAKLKELYAFRYDGKTEGIDAFVATVMNNPMPDPTSAVTPVKEAPATTTTTSSTVKSSAMTSDTTSENSTGMAKPIPTKTSVTTDTKTTSNGTTTKTKTAVKKPAPKKKKTR